MGPDHVDVLDMLGSLRVELNVWLLSDVATCWPTIVDDEAFARAVLTAPFVPDEVAELDVVDPIHAIRLAVSLPAGDDLRVGLLIRTCQAFDEGVFDAYRNELLEDDVFGWARFPSNIMRPGLVEYGEDRHPFLGVATISVGAYLGRDAEAGSSKARNFLHQQLDGDYALDAAAALGPGDPVVHAALLDWLRKGHSQDLQWIAAVLLPNEPLAWDFQNGALPGDPWIPATMALCTRAPARSPLGLAELMTQYQTVLDRFAAGTESDDGDDVLANLWRVRSICPEQIIDMWIAARSKPGENSNSWPSVLSLFDDDDIAFSRLVSVDPGQRCAALLPDLLRCLPPQPWSEHTQLALKPWHELWMASYTEIGR